MIRSKYTIEDMRKIALERDGECLSDKYINGRTKLKWKCNKCNTIWEAIFESIKGTPSQHGSWCPKCGREKVIAAKKFTINDMHKLATERGGKCLSGEYKGTKTPLKWKCNKCNYIWNAKPENIIQGAWCHKCAGNLKITIEEAKKIADTRNGKCLSDNILNNRTPLMWQCELGHKWQATFSSIKGSKNRNGRWCPICSSGIRERVCRAVFENIFDKKFPKTNNLKWLVNTKGNRAELDGYCKDLKLAFEHQGEQHYKINRIFIKSNTQLENRKRDDELKRALCKKHKILLIEIPYSINLEQIELFIIKELRRLNFPFKKSKNKLNLKDIYSPKNLKEMKEIAFKNNGKCLSDTYLGSEIHLRWKCEKGHIWTATPYSIKFLKTWCPICAGNKKLNLKDTDLLEKIIKYTEKYGHVPSRDQWRNKKLKPSISLYKRRFGSWGNAVKKAGLQPKPYGKGRVSDYTEEILIKKLQDFSHKLKRIPIAHDLDKVKDMPGKNTYIKFFGSWSNTLKIANLK